MIWSLWIGDFGFLRAYFYELPCTLSVYWRYPYGASDYMMTLYLSYLVLCKTVFKLFSCREKLRYTAPLRAQICNPCPVISIIEIYFDLLMNVHIDLVFERSKLLYISMSRRNHYCIVFTLTWFQQYENFQFYRNKPVFIIWTLLPHHILMHYWYTRRSEYRITEVAYSSHTLFRVSLVVN